MATAFRLDDFLNGSDDEDSQTCDSIMAQLHNLKMNRSRMMRKTAYSIELKRSRKEVDVSEYKLDDTWLDYLDKNKAGWLRNPETFFYSRQQHIGKLVNADPFSRIVMRMTSMIWEKQRQNDRALPIDWIANCMCQHFSQLSPQSAMKIIRRMEDQGSRFINLEKALGRGAAFVISGQASEQLGTPAVAKGGKEFQRIVRQLELRGVREKAAQYLEVRDRLEQWFSDELLKHKRTTADPSLPSSVYGDTVASIAFDNESIFQL